MVKYKYCPECKTKMITKGKHPHCPSCGITIYKNSIPCVGILPIKGGKVLLSKRAIEPHKGAWDIIGGILENGEHPLDGIKREAKEETGLDVEPIEMLGIYIDEYGDGRKTLNLHYIGKVKGGKIKPQEDVESLHWVSIEKIPTSKGFKNTREALEDLKKWYKK